jgi:hypothetical protein
MYFNHLFTDIRIRNKKKYIYTDFFLAGIFTNARVGIIRGRIFTNARVESIRDRIFTDARVRNIINKSL